MNVGKPVGKNRVLLMAYYERFTCPLTLLPTVCRPNACRQTGFRRFYISGKVAVAVSVRSFATMRVRHIQGGSKKYAVDFKRICQ